MNVSNLRRYFSLSFLRVILPQVVYPFKNEIMGVSNHPYLIYKLITPKLSTRIRNLIVFVIHTPKPTTGLDALSKAKENPT